MENKSFCQDYLLKKSSLNTQNSALLIKCSLIIKNLKYIIIFINNYYCLEELHSDNIALFNNNKALFYIFKALVVILTLATRGSNSAHHYQLINAV